jgi:hypothetical protein
MSSYNMYGEGNAIRFGGRSRSDEQHALASSATIIVVVRFTLAA